MAPPPTTEGTTCNIPRLRELRTVPGMAFQSPELQPSLALEFCPTAARMLTVALRDPERRMGMQLIKGGLERKGPLSLHCLKRQGPDSTSQPQCIRAKGELGRP